MVLLRRLVAVVDNNIPQARQLGLVCTGAADDSRARASICKWLRCPILYPPQVHQLAAGASGGLMTNSLWHC